jgi:predicted AAA+ superfamily ATPase
MKNRYLTDEIFWDLADGKMAFIGGPRQVGKTTMAKTLIASKFKRPPTSTGTIEPTEKR